MEALQKAIEKIKEQQSGEKPHSQVRMLGNQLIDMLVKCPDAAEIVLADLEGASMRIQDCAAKLKSYADKIRKEEKRDIVAISPQEAEKVIADFYGITGLIKSCFTPPEQEPPVQQNKPSRRKLLNLADFM